MELLYKPPTLCERSAYDSLWSRIAIASTINGSLPETLSFSQISLFLKGFGFSDTVILSEIKSLPISTDNSCNLSSDGSDKKYSRQGFYVFMRALSVAQHSTLRRISVSDIEEAKYCDIPLFRLDRYPYSPSSACERSAYESLWYRLNSPYSANVSGSRVVSFALKSGLLKTTLSKCWKIALADSGRNCIQKEEFFVFLRCISFVQVTGIIAVTKEHILSTACR